jgi:hypothetical protein
MGRMLAGELPASNDNLKCLMGMFDFLSREQIQDLSSLWQRLHDMVPHRFSALLNGPAPL